MAKAPLSPPKRTSPAWGKRGPQGPNQSPVAGRPGGMPGTLGQGEKEGKRGCQRDLARLKPDAIFRLAVHPRGRMIVCMIEKEFDAIVKEDIEALVTNAVPEGRSIEYKEQLPKGSDDDSREFLADVSSFANASGGDLIYRVADKRDADGKPTGTPEAKGLAGINLDEQKTRLENLLRQNIDPRIPGIRIKHLDGFPSGPIIVLRIRKSWVSPHMVRFRKSSRFFSRHSGGKYELDVGEIRAAFLASDSLGDKISAFRADRVGKILAGETPVPLQPGPKFVVHLLPIRAFAEGVPLDLRAAQQEHMEPMGKPGTWGPFRFNFDGLFSPGGSESRKPFSYIQLFRNGAIEAVYARITTTKGNCIFGIDCESQLLKHPGPSYMRFQKQLGLGPPLFITISMLSAKGFTIIPVDGGSRFGMAGLVDPSLIDRDVLLAPEVLVEEDGDDLEKLLRPAFDTFWQATGWTGSPAYDESDHWTGYRNFLPR